jgi:Family of unknown function (DUF6516)
MDISQLYEDQRARAIATFPDIVSTARVLRFDSGEPLKLRIEIIDGSIVDIFYSVTGKYSYHWERSLIDGSISRHDHAPHQRWQGIKTFPKHFHHGSEDAGEERDLSDDPRMALDECLALIRLLSWLWPFRPALLLRQCRSHLRTRLDL